MARERQRHALLQQQVHRSQSTGHGGVSQDVRGRYSASTVRILAREKKCISEDHEDLRAARPAPLWINDKVTNRARSALDEYTELRDSTEFTMSLDEVPVQKKGYKCVFEIALKRILEGNESQRSAALEVSQIILDGKRLQDDELTNLLLETLEFLPDIAIDSPKAISHVSNILIYFNLVWQVADLLALIFDVGVIPAEWLTKDDGRKIGNSSCECVPERGRLFAELASRLYKDPRTAGHFSQFTHSA